MRGVGQEEEGDSGQDLYGWCVVVGTHKNVHMCTFLCAWYVHVYSTCVWFSALKMAHDMHTADSHTLSPAKGSDH